MASNRSYREHLIEAYPVRTVFLPALQAGAFTGSAGLLFGGVLGIIRSSTPVLFAMASSLQWFALGSTFSLARAGISRAWEVQPTSSPADRVKLSAVAGGITGGFVGGVTRGRGNVIPGAVMFTTFGYIGQHLYNQLDERHTQKVQQLGADGMETGSLWKRVANSKWSPMKVLSDEEYEEILQEKLLRVQAEIAVLDDDIEKLKRRPVDMELERD